MLIDRKNKVILAAGKFNLTCCSKSSFNYWLVVVASFVFLFRSAEDSANLSKRGKAYFLSVLLLWLPVKLGD